MSAKKRKIDDENRTFNALENDNLFILYWPTSNFDLPIPDLTHGITILHSTKNPNR